MTSKYIERPRLREKLKNIRKYPLSIIHAPMGYGKTVAVREYLRTQEDAETAWVSLAASEGSEDYLWSRLCGTIGKFSCELSGELKAVGFPYDSFKTSSVLDILMDYEYQNDLIWIFDDFQCIDNGQVFEVFKSIACERIRKLHIVLITRELDKVDAADLYQKQLCFTVTEKSLKFSREESMAYIEFMAGKLDEEKKEEIYRITDGWESMLYITMKGIQQGLPIRKSATADDIIEQNFYSHLDDREKGVLLKLSVLPAFSKIMASAVLADPELYQVFENLANQRLFFVFNEQEQTYQIRTIIREFLYEKAVVMQIDFRKIFSRGGEWMLKNGNHSKAIEYLLRAGEEEKVLSILDDESTETSEAYKNETIRGIFEQGDVRLLGRYPFAALRYYLAWPVGKEHHSIHRVKRHLDQIEEFIKKSEWRQEKKQTLLGEIYAVRYRISYNDVERMEENIRKADAYFNGDCSRLVTRETVFTYGLPSMIFGYYTGERTLASVRDFFVQNSMVLTGCTDGCGAGCDSLAVAESALESGSFQTAELNAYKAYYKAEAFGQLSIMINANFVLQRLNVPTENAEDRNVLNRKLQTELLRVNMPVLNTTMDLCSAYINACLERRENIPLWILQGELSRGAFTPWGEAYFWIVYGKVLLTERRYIELDALCESWRSRIRSSSHRLAEIYFKIYESVSKSYLENRPYGEEILREALELARQDHIILPFAENGNQIKVMLQTIAGKSADTFLHDLTECCQSYAGRLKYLKSSMVELTEREIEILKFLDEGDTHDEIAQELYISIATVRYHIKNVYQKLGVNNKILALRKAKELNLI